MPVDSGLRVLLPLEVGRGVWVLEGGPLVGVLDRETLTDAVPLRVATALWELLGGAVRDTDDDVVADDVPDAEEEPLPLEEGVPLLLRV